jgi:hypothetical protein
MLRTVRFLGIPHRLWRKRGAGFVSMPTESGYSCPCALMMSSTRSIRLQVL